MDNPPEPVSPTTTSPEETKRPDYTIGMLCHLLSLTQFLGVPLSNIIAPLVLWLLKRNEDAFADACGKEALNFQISMTIYLIIAGILIFAFVGLFIIPVVMILNLVYTIIASIKASEGIVYQYPLTIRFIK